MENRCGICGKKERYIEGEIDHLICNNCQKMVCHMHPSTEWFRFRSSASISAEDELYYHTGEKVQVFYCEACRQTMLTPQQQQMIQQKSQDMDQKGFTEAEKQMFFELGLSEEEILAMRRERQRTQTTESTQVHADREIESTINAGTQKCPRCGLESLKEYRFCHECGKKFFGSFR